ncbi:MAG: tetratricopeptide repeat protein [Bacteroidota bacterium]
MFAKQLKPVHLTICFIILSLPFTGWAQISPYHELLPLYEDAVELFEKGKYGATAKKIDAFLAAEKELRSPENNDIHANALYMQAISAYHLDRNDAEPLMQEFIFEYGENTKANLARYFLGKFYFSRKKYPEAIEPLLTAYNAGGLDQKRFDEVVFLLGYAYFMDNRNRDATRFFQIAGRRQNPYQEDAFYYRSVILYQDQDYLAAYDAFQELRDSQKYGDEIKGYLANTLFQLKKYDELFQLGDEVIRSRSRKKNTEVYYVVANAGFERNDYNRAAEFYGRYVKDRGRMNRTDYFRFGNAQYNLGEYDEAIKLFDRAQGRVRDSLYQVSSYYLGFCFLKKEPKDESGAKFAFQQAAEEIPNGNAQVTEDALYQYGKVAFATEAYDESLNAFTRLQTEFPGTRHKTEIQSLIGEIYLYTRDYARSIEYFESIPLNNSRTRKAYQTVCYYYGLELFERPDYRQARTYFRKAIDNAFDPTLALNSRYWLGESSFRQGEFSQAKAEYQAYLRSSGATRNTYYPYAFYGIGWSDFKQKNYPGALKNFEDFIAKGGRRVGKNHVVDAYLRAGDCQFLQRRYSQANTYYSKVVDLRYTFQDYALYQLGESYYRQGQYQSSVGQFDRLINGFRESELRDNALDRISEIYSTWIKDNRSATRYAQLLVRDYPKSPLAAPAYNRMALAAYYSGDERSAVTFFKKVLSDYSQERDEAQVALDNLSGILSEAEFDRVLRDYRSSNPKMDNNLAGLVFSTGQDRFFSGNYNSAIEQFSTYIRDYKNGPNYFEALLFRARSYRETNKSGEALSDYQKIYGATARNNFTNVALLEAAEIQFEKKNYQNSLALYKELDQTAGKLANRVQAKLGIAKSYKAMRDYTLAINVLREISSNNEVAVYSRTQAKVEEGTCLYLDGKLEQAYSLFKDVEQEFKNQFGAESQHRITQILFDQGKKYKDQAEVFSRQGNTATAEQRTELANQKFDECVKAGIYQQNNYPTFNEWNAKSFLILAEAYYEMGNTFQAKGTLESLVNQDIFPDIKRQAQDRLSEIESEENATQRLFDGGLDEGGN